MSSSRRSLTQRVRSLMLLVRSLHFVLRRFAPQDFVQNLARSLAESRSELISLGICNVREGKNFSERLSESGSEEKIFPLRIFPLTIFFLSGSN